ncbi:MAG TPA: PPA1309 family protein [Marmoricola sp.]|nr:PPA1309 family protein [Marmoricola sp.]
MTNQPDEQQVLDQVVREIEAHAAGQGWDQPERLFAVVETADLVRREPQLAEALGVEGEAGAEAPSGYTPVEQESVPEGLEELLTEIVWPPDVAGCAAVVERLVLPPEADDAIPDDPAEARAFAAEHPQRQEVRIVAAVLRSGTAACALRLRSHDDPESVVTGPDLVPALVELLRATLEEMPDE